MDWATPKTSSRRGKVSRAPLGRALQGAPAGIPSPNCCAPCRWFWRGSCFLQVSSWVIFCLTQPYKPLERRITNHCWPVGEGQPGGTRGCSPRLPSTSQHRPGARSAARGSPSEPQTPGTSQGSRAAPKSQLSALKVGHSKLTRAGGCSGFLPGLLSQPPWGQGSAAPGGR